MLTLGEARERILADLLPLPPETVPLAQAAGRVLATAVHAARDLPSFDNSAMDGYAVRSGEVAGASAARPVLLRCVGRIEAGAGSSLAVPPGGCARVFTGAPLPPGADAVAMQEDTRGGPGVGDSVEILAGVAPGENVRRRGTDIQAGSGLFGTGETLGPGAIALLAAIGCATVRVGARPSVALLATGNELRQPGEALAPGQIYESNTLALSAMVQAAGGRPEVHLPAADEPEALREAVRQAFATAGVVVTSGGVSVGDKDLVRATLASLGGSVALWQVAVKPGKPFAFGHLHGKPWFGLPGNPVSALVTFWLLVRPALRRLQGAADLRPPQVRARLAERLANPAPRPHFLRVLLQDGEVRSAGAQGSHVLRSLARAAGLLEVPPETVLAEGAEVDVLLWD